jgi:outer membrane protein TolC
MKFRPLLACFALLVGTSTFAQTTLTLDEAIRLGRDNSPIAKQILASYESNRWAYRSVQAGLKPQLVFDGAIPGYSRRIERITQPDGSYLFRPVNQAFSFASMSVEQAVLATGGTVSLRSGLNRVDLFQFRDQSYWQTSPVSINYTQPLFRFNLLKWRVQQQEILLSQATQQQLENLEELSVGVASRFFDVYLATLQLRNAASNQAINDTIYRIARGRYGLGKIAENELLQVELSYTNARNSVEQNRVALTVAERQLQLLTGLVGTGSGFGVLPPLSASLVDPDPERALAEAKANRSDYLNFTLTENAAQRDLREANINRRFQGDLQLSYGLNQTAPNLAAAYRTPLSAQYAGATFTIPLLNFGKNKADAEVARYTLEAQQRENENARNTLELDVYTAVLELKQLKTSLLISAKSDTIAQKRYEVARNRYLIGKVDITNLLIAQQDKDAALLAYVRTLQQYWTAYYRLRRLTLFDFEAGRKIGG